MSWNSTARGSLAQVLHAVTQSITNSVAHDDRLAEKAGNVAKATEDLITTAAGEQQAGKEFQVITSGHLDQGGLSSYSLQVSQTYIEPSIRAISDEQIAEATGAPASAE